MRQVNLQGAPTGTTDQKINWLTNAIRDVAGASTDNNPIDIASAFQIVGTFTPTRTLNTSTATLADLINVFCTLVTDFQKGGTVRSQ